MRKGFFWVGLLGLAVYANDELPQPVQAIQAQMTSLRQPLRYAGVVKPRYIIDVGFRVGGKLKQRLVNIGETVSQGQKLAVLDSLDFALNVQNSRAQVAAAQADVDKSAIDLKRAKELLQTNTVSKDNYETALNRYNVTQAHLKQTKAALNIAENQATYAELIADFNGVVTETLAESGQVVSVGQPIFKIARPEDVEVSINIPEQRLHDITPQTEMQISLLMSPQQVYQGKLRELAPQADPTTRTYLAKISVLNPNVGLQWGKSATVIITQNPTPIIPLPIGALVKQNNQTAVWIIDLQGKTHFTPVVVGEFLDGKVAIISGLQDGQWVVTAGTHKLIENQKVKVLQE
jgi:membrane fusion protein, multidrug efflux system